MRKYLYIILPLLLLSVACDRDEKAAPNGPKTEVGADEVPEGYFVARFSGDAGTRGVVTGADPRVQELRYILYDASGNLVKVRDVELSDWPITEFRDTLPKGSYTAIFAGNLATGLDATPNYADARITMPSTPFTETSMYYMDKVAFSDGTPSPTVTLQRIVGMLALRRNAIDTNDALTNLGDNLVATLVAPDLISTTVNDVLSTSALTTMITGDGIIGDLLSLAGILINVTDDIINPLRAALISPIILALDDLLLSTLLERLETTLEANADQQFGITGALGMILNPWNWTNAVAVVTIDGFPKSMNLDGAVVDYYANGQQFLLPFTGNQSMASMKEVHIVGLHGSDAEATPYTVQKINVIEDNGGLLNEIVVDMVVGGIVDDMLIPGSLIDVVNPITATTPMNTKWQADYSLIDLTLNDMTTDAQNGLNVSLSLTQVAGLHNIVDGVLGGLPIGEDIVDPVFNLLSTITITLPTIDLPVLNINNLNLSGGWSVAAQVETTYP